MIIDFLDKYPIKDQNKILDMARRWYIHEYRHFIDLYGIYNDMPYWGEGECNCKGDCSYEWNDRTECVDYQDSNYNEWFDGIITTNEKEQIDEIEEQIIRQIELFDEDDEWKPLHINISYRLMKWLNENDITYCIIRGLVSHHDCIFLKNAHLDSAYRLLFGTPTTYDMKYAVDEMGWTCYDIYELTNVKVRKEIRIIRDWTRENCFGVVHQWDDGALLFEDEIDAMAVKLRWADYDEV